MKDMLIWPKVNNHEIVRGRLTFMCFPTLNTHKIVVPTHKIHEFFPNPKLM